MPFDAVTALVKNYIRKLILNAKNDLCTNVYYYSNYIRIKIVGAYTVNNR